MQVRYQLRQRPVETHIRRLVHPDRAVARARRAHLTPPADQPPDTTAQALVSKLHAATPTT